MLEVKAERCAGIDVGKKFLAVCVMIGPANEKPAVEVRRFGTTVKELERLRTWLWETACTGAVMESTGSYWKPVFNILEGTLKVILANPEQVKAFRGKKTDPKDSRWLASLLRHGLVQGSFNPATRYSRIAGSDAAAPDVQSWRQNNLRTSVAPNFNLTATQAGRAPQSPDGKL